VHDCDGAGYLVEDRSVIKPSSARASAGTLVEAIDYGPNDATWKLGAEQLPARELGALPAEGASIVCGPLRAGHPAAAPIEASNDAGPVIVGNDGAGAAVSRLLGSVSQKVARQAAVPVVAVHSHDGGPASPEGRAGTP